MGLDRWLGEWVSGKVRAQLQGEDHGHLDGRVNEEREQHADGMGKSIPWKSASGYRTVVHH